MLKVPRLYSIGAVFTSSLSKKRLVSFIKENTYRCHSTSANTSSTQLAPKKFKCFISKCNDPYINLAFEDWLLRNSAPDSYVLYLWRNRPCVVIGRNQNPWKECNLELMKERDVWLARRSSGGGSVYHDMGNTNYSVFMPREAFSRELSAKMVAKALVQNDIPAYVNKRHDIAVDDFKVSGSAFKLTQKRAFHHGTMLIDVDLTRLKGCLHSGKDTLIANGVASVPSPVVNLRDYSWTIDHATFCNSVKLEFVKQFGTSQDIVEEVVWDETLIDVVDEIKQERDKLKTWDWLYGQTPEFTYTLSNTFDWGQVSVKLTSRHGVITDFAIESSEPQLGGGIIEQATAILKGCTFSKQDIQKASGGASSDPLRQVIEWVSTKI